MMEMRPGQRLYIPGVRVVQPRTVAASSWWLSGGVTAGQCAVAYAPKGAGDLAASYINLNAPGSNNAAPGVAPTLAAGGWVFNGSTQYLTTGIVPGQDYTVICQFTSWTRGVDKTLFGCFGATDQSFCAISITSSSLRYYRGAQLSVTTSIANGNVAIAGKNAYRDGVSDGTIPAGGIAPTFAIFIGALNNASAIQHSAVTVAAFAIYNITLDATTVGTLRTAMAAL